MVVGLLVGSFVFVADFIRALHRIGCKPIVEFIRLSSYGLGRESSGSVRLIGETELDLAGRVVLLVDDIVDTGRTLLYARDLLRERGVASVFIGRKRVDNADEIMSEIVAKRLVGGVDTATRMLVRGGE